MSGARAGVRERRERREGGSFQFSATDEEVIVAYTDMHAVDSQDSSGW